MSGFNTDFTPSGTGHNRGTVPDPGSTAGTTHYLREDATWAIPRDVPSGPPPPAPGPDLNQWACNIAGYLTYEVSRIAVKYVVDWFPISWLGDVVGGITVGVLHVLLPEEALLFGALDSAIFTWVSTYVSGHLADIATVLVDDVLWAKIHCALYTAIAASPTDLAAAITAAVGVIGAFVGYPAPAIAAIAYFLQHIGVTNVSNIPITAFVKNYDCSSCPMTGIGPLKPLMQTSFDLTVTDGTDTGTFIDKVKFTNATVAVTGSEADVTMPSAPLGSDSAPGIVQGDGTSTFVDGSGVIHAGGYTVASVCSAVGTGLVLDIGTMPGFTSAAYPYTAELSWLNSTAPSGWQNVVFTETGWIAPVASNSEAGVYDFPAGAATIAASTAGTEAAGQTFLVRHHFNLPSGPVAGAILYVNADDYVLGSWLNGHSLGAKVQSVGYLAFIIPPELLTSTNNVLAIAVMNGGGWYATGYCVSLLLTEPSSVLVAANGTTAGLEPAIEFVDTATVQWTVTDDPTNDRVQVEATAAGGTVTGVSATAPLTSTGGATPVIALTVPLATNYGGLGLDTSAATLGTILANTGSGWHEVTPLSDGLVATSDHTAAGGVKWDSPSGITPGSGSIWMANLIPPPVAASWTLDNGTIADAANGVIGIPSGSPFEFHAHGSLGSTPYTVNAAFVYQMASLNTTSLLAGIFVSDGTHDLEMTVGSGTAGLQAVYGEPNVGNINIVQYDPAVFWTVVWIRIQNDGTHRNVLLSQDGITFRLFFQEAHNAHLTETEAGFDIRGTGADSITLLSWQITHP